MSQITVEQLIGRLVTDAGFRERVARSLDLVCIEEGYDLTEAERRIVAALDMEWLSLNSDGKPGKSHGKNT